MRIVVAFVSAVLLALQLAPTFASVIRPRRELPDFFSQILQRVKKDAAVGDSSNTGDEDGDKTCTRDEDCEVGQVCISPDPAVWNFRDPRLGLICVPECPLPSIYYPSTGDCHRLGDPPGPLPGQGGYSCEAAAHCNHGLCCGYGTERFRSCKPFEKEGEPCRHFNTSAVRPWSLMSGVPTKTQLQGGDCCEPGFRCGKKGVCIKDVVHDTEETGEIRKPPVQD